MSQNSSDDTKKKIALWKRFAYPLFLTAALVGLHFASQFVVVAIFKLLSEYTPLFSKLNESLLMTALLAFSWMLTFGVILIVLRIRKVSFETLRKLFGIRKPSWLGVGVVIPFFIAALIVGSILTSFVAQLFPGFDSGQKQDVGFESISLPIEYVAAFVMLVVIAPFAEELLFRGYMYSKFRNYMPAWLTIILTSAVFGVVHIQPNIAITTFALGIFLALAREITGSIWASIAIHMMKNGIAYYLLFINPTLIGTLGS